MSRRVTSSSPLKMSRSWSSSWILVFQAAVIAGLDGGIDGRPGLRVFVMPALEEFDPRIQAAQLQLVLEARGIGDFERDEPARLGELRIGLTGHFAGRGARGIPSPSCRRARADGR